MEYVKTTMIDTLLDLLAPHRCSSCGEIGSILCESCKYDIVSDPFSGCLLCARPCGKRGVCESCVRGTVIVQAWCVAERRDGMKTMLDAYKFDSTRAVSSVCAALLEQTIPVLSTDVVVVSIPSAASTIRARGFDHMGRIADEFAKCRGLRRAWPLRRASVKTLHFLPRAERIHLGPSLFRLSGGPVPEKILLLDDIVTTGTTFLAAVKLLKSAGVKEVYIAALARQMEE